ncbi:hypothetical protein GCM10010191_48770 [Actinomadura vinacea]|uniref:Uncharacterized protein n=1 Tax=Actinomadura vinacea TaxID=115336 RepID=A0ABN3JJA0_9ACTN
MPVQTRPAWSRMAMSAQYASGAPDRQDSGCGASPAISMSMACEVWSSPHPHAGGVAPPRASIIISAPGRDGDGSGIDIPLTIPLFPSKRPGTQQIRFDLNKT